MAHYETELFVQCVYSLELSYHDLLEREAELKLAINEALENNGAEFIHFEPMGDTMRAQCMFAAHAEDLFHEICKGLAPHMDGNVEARLLFVHKNLDLLHIYTISKKKWKEACLSLPLSGPIAKALLEQKAAKK